MTDRPGFEEEPGNPKFGLVTKAQKTAEEIAIVGQALACPWMRNLEERSLLPCTHHHQQQIDRPFKQHLRGAIATLCHPKPVQPEPSQWECRYCKLSSQHCSAKVMPQTSAAG